MSVTDHLLLNTQHTRDSLFALLDLAVPREKLKATDDYQAGPGYVMQHGVGRFKVMGNTRFALEDAIRDLLGVPIGDAEKLALDYAVARGYAIQVWATKGGAHGQAQDPAHGD